MEFYFYNGTEKMYDIKNNCFKHIPFPHISNLMFFPNPSTHNGRRESNFWFLDLTRGPMHIFIAFLHVILTLHYGKWN